MPQNESVRVQISVWCYMQARRISKILKELGIDVGEFEDHRDPKDLDFAFSDDIDLLLKKDLGPSIHFFLDVDRGTVEVIEAAAKRSVMWFKLSFDKDSPPPIALRPSIHTE